MKTILNLRPVALLVCLLLAATAGVAPAQTVINNFAGTGAKGFDGDEGPATAAQLNDPGGICRGPDGSLYICDTANHRIRQVKPDGRLVTLVGIGGSSVTEPILKEPYEVRLDAAGNLFWVERLTHCVRRRDHQSGMITTVAGNGTPGFSGDGGPADKAQLNEPHSIGFDKAGDLYICDVRNNRIRKVDMKTHVISTFSGTGERKPTPDGAPIPGTPLSGPRALDFDAVGNLWLALREGNMVLRLDLANGVVHHVAGTGQKGFGGNGGPAKEATLNGPKGISVAPDGNVYIADTENHAVRMIDTKTGHIELIAGTGTRGDGPEGDPLKCQLARPHGVFVDRDGLIFIGDTEAQRVRVIRPVSTDAPRRVFLMDAKYLQATRQRIRSGDTIYVAALAALERDAKTALKFKPVSVVDKAATPPSGDKHDYMSQAPYFWPNPATSNGLPYIRRDGERNPDINKISDHANIGRVPETAETLALAFYYTGNETYAAKAAEILRVWFLNPETRMNPNLQYAQAVLGVNSGRGIGLIESRGLVHAVDAIGLLSGSKSWTKADDEGLKKWFGDFLRWMQESKNGRDESAAKNNHGTYYDVQVISFALFLGDTNFARQVASEAREKRIAVQIEPDGRQPLELVRTKAWSYSTGNLAGLMQLAKLAECVGVDLWQFETKDGRSICKALDYLTPFATGEQQWPHQQLGGWSADGYSPLLRQAALHFPERYGALANKVSKENTENRNLLLRPKLMQTDGKSN
jgi:streptogramin lyase